MTTYLEITNLASRGENLSLAGGPRGSASVNILPFQTAEVPVHDVQFDTLWLETLASYVERSKARVVLDGYVLTSDDIRELKHTDINEILGQWLESKEREFVPSNPGHGRFYSGADGHPHYMSGSGSDYDLANASPSYIYPVVNDVLLIPPGAPSDEDSYLINGIGAGLWVGHDYEVAEWNAGVSSWVFTAYVENDVILCSGTLNPMNEGFWRKTATLWNYMGSDVIDPCLDILLTDAALPPPSDGDRYLVNGVGAGSFIGHNYEVAEWNAGAGVWAFTAHVKGTTVTVAGEITPSNFGSYLKGSISWELIPAVASSLELKPSCRAAKGRYSRIINVAGDSLYTGYRTNMGTFLVLGNTNPAAGVYTFRVPRVGTTTTNTTYANPGWECVVYCPIGSHGSVALQSRDGLSTIATVRPGEMWMLKARNETTAGAAGWQAVNLSSGGTYDSGEAVWVDGSRTDVYVPTGKENLPYKTIQEGLDACPRGGIVKIKFGEYVENVVTVADKHIDADVGTLLRSIAGDTLTFTDDAIPPTSDVPCFMRGLNVQGEDPTGWAMRVRSLGVWNPFVVVLDQLLASKNAANILWCEGGGVYLTDAGGTGGDAPICCRAGRAADAIGGEIITGRYNLGCAAGGKLFEIHEGGMVQADGLSANTNGPGAVFVDMLGKNTPGERCSFEMRFGRTNSDWLSFIRATGENVQVRIDNDYGDDWGRFQGDVFDMPEGGELSINDGDYSSNGGRVLRFGRNVPAVSHGSISLRRVRVTSPGMWAGNTAEILGNVFGSLDDVTVRQRNVGASGTFVAAYNGTLSVVGGACEGPGPTIDLQSGQLFLLGGVDIVPTGVGLPGSVPIAVGIGATLNRGHVNIRSGVPIVSGTENLLPSSFGMVELGPLGLRARIGSGRALPGGGLGYGAGSVFMLVPIAGQPEVYQNIGTEAAPTWVALSYVAAVPANWAGGVAPTNVKSALDRIAAALNAHGIPA